MRSVQFLQKAASLRKEFPGLTVMPVAPGKRENIEKALLHLKMDMPSLVDEKAAAFKDYRVRLTPRVYLDVYKRQQDGCFAAAFIQHRGFAWVAGRGFVVGLRTWVLRLSLIHI